MFFQTLHLRVIQFICSCFIIPQVSAPCMTMGTTSPSNMRFHNTDVTYFTVSLHKIPSPTVIFTSCCRTLSYETTIPISKKKSSHPWADYSLHFLLELWPFPSLTKHWRCRAGSITCALLSESINFMVNHWSLLFPGAS